MARSRDDWSKTDPESDDDVPALVDESDSESSDETPRFYEPADPEPWATPCAKKRRLCHKQAQSASERRAANLMLPVKVFRRLFRMGWPIVCFNLLIVMNHGLGQPAEDLACVEYYSGIGSVAHAWEQHGFKAVEYDVNRNQMYENMLTAPGFLTALTHARRLAPGALAHFATVCSTWVFMSRSCTGRTEAMPYGIQDEAGFSANVGDGNIMVGRMAVILMLLVARHVQWVLEQPATSVMDRCPILEHVQPRYKVTTWMGAFGALTRKPTWLLSGSAWISHMARHLPRDACPDAVPTTHREEDDHHGRKRCTGNANLKGTQAYPPGFGSALFQAWSSLSTATTDDDSLSDVSLPDGEYREMDHDVADLGAVAAFFGVSATEFMFDTTPPRRDISRDEFLVLGHAMEMECGWEIVNRNPDAATSSMSQLPLPAPPRQQRVDNLE